MTAAQTKEEYSKYVMGIGADKTARKIVMD
jgi:hypothetical protein